MSRYDGNATRKTTDQRNSVLHFVHALIKQCMSSRRFWFEAVIIAFATILATPVHAEMKCEVDNVSKALAAGVIPIPMGVSAGSTLSSLPASAFQNRCYFANSGTVVTSGVSLINLSTTTPLAAGYTDVYTTTIGGLGIRYTFTSSDCTPASATMSDGKITISCPFSGPLSGGTYIYKDVQVTASFVVIGTVKGGTSTLSSAPVVSIGLASQGLSGDWSKSPLYTGVASGTFTLPTCSAQTPKPVKLDEIKLRDLSSVGTTAGRKDFELSFNCSSGAKVSIVITDVATPSNRTNILTLAPDSTAKGVGIQVLKADGTPVSFGPDATGSDVANQWLIGASPNGTLTLPLSAQYVRTGDVVPGSLRALATFTMSYN
jgi:type 1 fimbria pilin